MLHVKTTKNQVARKVRDRCGAMQRAVSIGVVLLASVQMLACSSTDEQADHSASQDELSPDRLVLDDDFAESEDGVDAPRLWQSSACRSLSPVADTTDFTNEEIEAAWGCCVENEYYGTFQNGQGSFIASLSRDEDGCSIQFDWNLELGGPNKLVCKHDGGPVPLPTSILEDRQLGNWGPQVTPLDNCQRMKSTSSDRYFEERCPEVLDFVQNTEQPFTANSRTEDRKVRTAADAWRCCVPGVFRVELDDDERAAMTYRVHETEEDGCEVSVQYRRRGEVERVVTCQFDTKRLPTTGEEFTARTFDEFPHFERLDECELVNAE